MPEAETVESERYNSDATMSIWRRYCMESGVEESGLFGLAEGFPDSSSRSLDSGDIVQSVKDCFNVYRFTNAAWVKNIKYENKYQRS